MDEARAAEEINKYRKFRKVDGATYRKVNQFLRKRTYITAREWALARLCTDFRTTNGAEMTFIGQHLPDLVPFMEEPYSPQAVNQARHSFKKKVRKSSATFFYGAMCGFFTTEELDDLLFEASEVARFLLEVESTTLDIDEEIDIEDRITGVMRSVGESAKTILKTRVLAAGKETETARTARDPQGDASADSPDRSEKPVVGGRKRGRPRKVLPPPDTFIGGNDIPSRDKSRGPDDPYTEKPEAITHAEEHAGTGKTDGDAQKDPEKNMPLEPAASLPVLTGNVDGNDTPGDDRP